MTCAARIGLLFLLMAALCISTPPARSVRAQDAAAESQQELARGDALFRQRQYEEALKAYKRANSLAGNKCLDCLWGQAQAFHEMGAYKNAGEVCDKVVELAGADAKRAARAFNLKGVGLIALSEGKKEDKMRAAEESLRRALELNPELHIARFNLGSLLLKQNRDAAGVELLEDYLRRDPRGPAAAEARSLMENPRRAREAFSPDFSLVTLDGQYLTLDELYGKVVMLDFWFTTCPPCVASIPALQRLAKKFEKDNFVLISVSVDGDEDKWREFIEKNKMVWPQHRDTSRKLVNAFAVKGYPTYILLDFEGVMRHRSMGYGEYKDGEFEETIRKWLKARPAVLPERKTFAKAPPPPPAETQDDSSERPKVQLTRRPPVEMSGFGSADPQAPAATPAPEIRIFSTDTIEVQGRPFVRVFLTVNNWTDFPAELFAPSPDLPPCGANTQAARAWAAVRSADGRLLNGFCALRGPQSLQRFAFTVRPEQAADLRVYMTLHGRRTGKLYRSNVVALPISPAP